MKVVKVSAARDYEGIVWFALYTTVENAYKGLREADYEDVSYVDTIDIAWIGLDDDNTYERVIQLDPQKVEGTEEIRWFTWDSETKSNKEVTL